MNLAVLEGVRSRYPDWKYIIDGDGRDENQRECPGLKNQFIMLSEPGLHLAQ